MLQKITVTTSAVSLPFGTGARPLLQNLGPGNVYFANNSSVSTNYGFKLSPGMGYEFPDDMNRYGGWEEVWVISDGTADLRIGGLA